MIGHVRKRMAQMRIYDILKETGFDEILSKIELFYGSGELEDYKTLYNLLKTVSINSNYQELCIYITAYKESSSGEVISVDSFCEDDTTLFYDVSAYDSADTVYSIASSEYSDFLQYSVDDETIKNYSYSTILAHCFYELMSYGLRSV